MTLNSPESIKLKEIGLTGLKGRIFTDSRNRGTYKVNSGSFNYFNLKQKNMLTVDRPSYALTVEGGVNGTSNTVVLNNITKKMSPLLVKTSFTSKRH